VKLTQVHKDTVARSAGNGRVVYTVQTSPLNRWEGDDQWPFLTAVYSDSGLLFTQRYYERTAALLGHHMTVAEWIKG